MESEFDKQIDVILRRSREESFDDNGRGISGHLDADEVSAFAESALPESARLNYISHFADCSRCRKILSNLMVLNAAEESVAEPVTAVAEAEATPWYRRLFVFPNLAYSLGALLLVFSAFFGYFALRNIGGDSVGELSQSTEPAFPKLAPATNPANTANSTANTAVSASNSNTAAATSNSAVPAATPPNSGGETFADDGLVSNRPAAPVGALRKDAEVAESKVATKESKTRQNVEEPVLAKPTPSVNQPTAGAAQTEKAARERDAADAKLKDNSDEPLKTRSAPQIPKKKEDRSEARRVGGKSFRNVGGIWFDADYNNLQPQISVKRGSDDYRKLDSGLRSITDQLGGTVVIAWKSKAYRIE